MGTVDAPAPDETPDGGEETPVEAEPAEIHGAPVTRFHGQLVVHADRSDYVHLVRALYDDGYRMCVDLCGVDRLLAPAPDLPAGVERGRFEVVVNLLCMDDRRRVRVRVQLPGDEPALPSLFELHPGTEAMEREAYDMFGIVFAGHPDLSRILMPDDWEGHPLRKDYAIGRIPVQFKGTPPPR